MLLDQIRHYIEGTRPLMIALCGAGGKTSALFDLAAEFKSKGMKVAVITTTRMMAETQPRIDAMYSVDQLKEINALDIGITMIAHGCDEAGKIFGFEPDEVDAFYLSGLADVVLVEADGANKKPIKAPREDEPRLPKETHLVMGVIGADVFGKKAASESVHRLPLFLKVTGLQEGDIITVDAIIRLIQAPNGLFGNRGGQFKKLVLINKALKAQDDLILSIQRQIALPVIVVHRGVWS